jgi:hypothetical protein
MPARCATGRACPGGSIAQDKNWIPHLKQDVEKVFDPARNKLLQEGQAQWRDHTVVLYDAERFAHRTHRRVHQPQDGTFGQTATHGRLRLLRVH